MEDSVEIVIEKLLHVTNDIFPKVTFFRILELLLPVFTGLKLLIAPFIQVSNDAEHCLTIVLSQYDPFRCLSVCILALNSFSL